MKSKNSTCIPNPRKNANIISILFWWWTVDLFRKGYNKELGLEDLYEPLPSDVSNTLGTRLEKQWISELQMSKKEKRNPSLFKTILRTFYFRFILLGILHGFNEIFLRISTPILLGYLLNYFKPNSLTTYKAAIIYAIGISIVTIISVIIKNLLYHGGLHIGGRIRIAICSVVYKKALRLNKNALEDTAPGKIVNLIANDVNRYEFGSLLCHHIWSAPLSSLIISYMLYYEAGYAGLIGAIFPFFVISPIQSYFNGKLISKFRLKTAIKTDERVRLMDEIIAGVQVIKMYAWEEPFCALIELARRLELKYVRKNSYIRGLFMIFGLFTVRISVYSALLAMLFFGEKLTADKVFVLFSYFNILSEGMSGMFIRALSEVTECVVSTKRLQTFLSFEEFETKNVINHLLETSNNKSISSMNEDNPTNISEQIFPHVDEYMNYDENNFDKNIKNNIVKPTGLSLSNRPTDRDLNEDRNLNNMSDEWAVKLNNITANWNTNSSDVIFKNTNLELKKGKFYIVIGAVGVGKTSFLSTILGEMNLQCGNVEINGRISYAAQESWIFGATIRQNILFGQKFNQEKYNKVVKVCALQSDFTQFQQGDLTVVGEKGSLLSGGQKSRINLARAVYRQADIYLLDDPLSAVDAHVGKHIFEKCLQSYLSGKTRILATHQLQYVKDADFIILLEKEKVEQYNNYHDLLLAHSEYSNLIFEKETLGQPADDSLKDKSFTKSQLSLNDNSQASCSNTEEIEEKDDNPVMAPVVNEKSFGTVKGNILINYFKVGPSLTYTLFTLFLIVLTQIIVSYTDSFTSEFVTAEESRAFYNELHNHKNNDSDATVEKTSKILDEDSIHSTNYYIYIYTTAVSLIFIVGLTRSFVFYDLSMRCSQNIHDLSFNGLIHTSLRFFDMNPSGTILNRFSKDLGMIDEQLPKALLDATQILFMTFGSFVLSCIVNPILLAPIGLIGLFFSWLRRVYLKTSNNVKRLEGMTRSPVFTHLNTTLNGLSTIRAFKAQSILMTEFDNFQNTHTSSYFMHISSATAFGFALNFCCSILTTVVVFIFLLLKDNFSGGQVGLVITQIIMMAEKIQWGMRQSATIENHMVSVERVLEYTNLPPETNLNVKSNLKKLKTDTTLSQDKLINTPKDWPDRGHIEFKNVYLRYSESDEPVLKALCFTIRPREKVGIVGRTGAGKSSLITAIFRLAKVEGTIEIDGIDTCNIALKDLRKRISIIPQDPVLFSGTLRRNLDPFSEFSDKRLWDVLEEVELKNIVTVHSNVLDSQVYDRGSNFSVGQRQLICLARAILRENRILLLDEATANVDPHTDLLIQKTIRTMFAQCTVLTIAHRLNTIMDSDKVLVMDLGRIAEFDEPHILLQNESGQFTSLVKKTGEASYKQLCKTAHDAYLTKRTINDDDD